MHQLARHAMPNHSAFYSFVGACSVDLSIRCGLQCGSALLYMATQPMALGYHHDSVKELMVRHSNLFPAR